MNHFVERLPGRIAALAGLLVGAASGWAGVDLWQCLLRMAIAFAVFYIAGWGLQKILLQAASSAGSQGGTAGNHLDEVTPEMTVEDLHPESQKPLPHRGDESKP